MNENDNQGMQVPAQSGTKGKGLGIAAMVLGIIAAVSAFVPLLNILSFPVVIVGLVLGIVSVVFAGGGKGPRSFGIAGIACSGAALIITIVMYASIGAVAATSDSSPTVTSDNAVQSTVEEEEIAPASGEISFDTPFEFDSLTISFSSAVTATTVKNEYSQNSGATVAAIPITITNNSSTTRGLNMFYYKAYGPDGTELDNISAMFMETDVAFAGEARSGGTIESTMYVIYTGPGDYFIEFTKPLKDETIEVRLPLSL